MARVCTLVWLIAVACLPAFADDLPTIGGVIQQDPRMAKVLDADGKIEVIATGFEWSEGPCWVAEDNGYLLFSDVLANSIFQWTETDDAARSGRWLGNRCSGANLGDESRRCQDLPS